MQPFQGGMCKGDPRVRALGQQFHKVECARVIQCKGIGAAIPQGELCKGDPMLWTLVGASHGSEVVK